MKQYAILLLMIGLIFLFGCRDRVVYYPIPLKSAVDLVIRADNGAYSYRGLIFTSDIYQDLQGELARYGVSEENIDRIRLEGVAYTLLETTNENVVVNGFVDVNYNDTTSTSFKNIMTLNDVTFGQIRGIPQTDALNAEGVSLLNLAMEDLVFNRGLGIIVVQSKGSLSVRDQVLFRMRVEFTITTVVKKDQTIFDPLGS